jgi:TatD DNase family protein
MTSETTAPAPNTSGSGTSPRWTDSHCHLQDVADLDAVLAGASAAGVDRIVCVGTGLEMSARALEIAGRSKRGVAGPLLWSTIGLHPHDAKDGVEPVLELLGATASATVTRGAPGALVGVGECGLDYHYDHSPRPVQLDVFARQVAAARALDLTLVVHTREAWDDTFDVLANEGVPDRIIIHCFTGGPDEAKRCLEVGAYLSFSGIVTFKGAPEVRAAAALCPLDRLLVETDAPFLAPVPHRGKPNEPAFVAVVGAALAEVKQLTADELARRTTENTAAAFGLRFDTGPG